MPRAVQFHVSLVNMMNTANGHFDLNTPEALFKKANSDYLSFFDNPNSWVLFNLLATFSHLLEWICPEAKGKPPKPTFAQGTPEQVFYYQMWNRTDYSTIRALCNKSKHFHHKPSSPNASVVNGARAGLTRAGDSLGQTYFIVDGTDISDVLMSVYISYKNFFRI